MGAESATQVHVEQTTKDWRVYLAAGILGANAMFLTGCGNGNSSENADSAPNGPSTAVSSPPVSGDTFSPPVKTCSAHDLSGCYSYEQAKKIADYSIADVDQAVGNLYTNMPPVAKVWYIEHGTTATTGCGQVDETSYEFCGNDNTVSLGQDTLWEFYDKAGDAAPVFAYAHEIGHHIQSVAGVPFPETDRQTIPHENQADCIAGAIFAELENENIATKSDLQDIDLLMPIIASQPEYVNGSVRNHGTIQERTESTLEGITGGLAECNTYYPDTPVIS
jgi:predicted metalloprotease